MGIYDRDYMRDDVAPRSGRGGRAGRPVGAVVARVCVVLLAIGLSVLALRVPIPIYLKIPVLVGVGFLIRYLWTLAREFEGHHFLKQGVIAERRGDYPGAVSHYERSLECRCGDSYVTQRLLSVYHAAGHVNKAAKLIETLDGTVVQERHVEELEHLVIKYRPVIFERVTSGFRVILAGSGKS